MTAAHGPRNHATRADEVAQYVEEVRAGLTDLPRQEQDELIEDLRAHLTEIAAEDPTPLVDRLGPPAAYAAELRGSATEPTIGYVPTSFDLLKARWREAWQRVEQVDQRLGPPFGYQRISEFGRLLVPGWWLVRGYLAAMIVVNILDSQRELGMLPRLGGSTLAGLVILAGFLAGSVWLGTRTPGLSARRRKAVLLGSGLVVLIGLVGFASLDSQVRYSDDTVRHVVGSHPVEHLTDVYAFDQEGQLLTGVTLLDQDGRPVELGWARCEESDSFEWVDPADQPPVTYPRCPDDLPWWLTVREPQLPTPTIAPTPTVEPTPTPSVQPSPTPTPVPSASASPTPGPDLPAPPADD